MAKNVDKVVKNAAIQKKLREVGRAVADLRAMLPVDRSIFTVEQQNVFRLLDVTAMPYPVSRKGKEQVALCQSCEDRADSLARMLFLDMARECIRYGRGITEDEHHWCWKEARRFYEARPIRGVGTDGVALKYRP